MIKTLVRSGIAIGVAVFAARQLVFGGRDLTRYNKMRDMSGDPPLGMSNYKPETNSQARSKNPLLLLMSIPSDLQRYLKLKSM